jgi:hypothetical protein
MTLGERVISPEQSRDVCAERIAIPSGTSFAPSTSTNSRTSPTDTSTIATLTPVGPQTLRALFLVGALRRSDLRPRGQEPSQRDPRRDGTR